MKRQDKTNDIALYRSWLESCLQSGLKAFSGDTAARILAVVFNCGDNAAITHNAKLRADLDYIQKRWKIGGGVTPEKPISSQIKVYNKLIADSVEAGGGYPEWASGLMLGRYGVRL